MNFPSILSSKENTKSGGAIGELTEKQNAVFQIIVANNRISYRTIAEKMGINESAVLKHIELLKEKKYITRIGGTRGSWKVRKM